MTKREKINRNIGLSFDLMQKIAENVSLLDNIPNGTFINFVEKDFIKKHRDNHLEKGKEHITLVKVISDLQVI